MINELLIDLNTTNELVMCQKYQQPITRITKNIFNSRSRVNSKIVKHFQKKKKKTSPI